MCRYIFHYNYDCSWQILITFVQLETWMNAPPRSYRLSNQIQPIPVATLLDKTKKYTKTADRFLQCILQNLLFQIFAESRSMFVSFPVY